MLRAVLILHAVAVTAVPFKSKCTKGHHKNVRFSYFKRTSSAVWSALWLWLLVLSNLRLSKCLTGWIYRSVEGWHDIVWQDDWSPKRVYSTWDVYDYNMQSHYLNEVALVCDICCALFYRFTFLVQLPFIHVWLFMYHTLSVNKYSATVIVSLVTI